VADRSTKTPATQQEEPVLVELFTSQGCSSCPPADKLLRSINERTDVEVIALSFHVDYWDYIGWRDPYSSKQATRRQQAYAAQIAQGRAYTPQLVVDGQAHVLGSNARDAVSAIEGAHKRPSSGVRLATSVLRKDKKSVRLDLGVQGKVSGKRLYLALYESGLVTKVRRGENAGRKIRNDYVVRHLVEVKTGESTITLDPSWDAEQLGVVAFAQDKKTLRIDAVHRLPL
jgi:hypothetical protein